MFAAVAFRRGAMALMSKQRTVMTTKKRILTKQNTLAPGTAFRLATSGARAVAEESSLVQFGAGGTPSSIRELQASLPAIQQRGTPKKDIRIKQTALKDDAAVMEVAWYDGKNSNYPYVWLRDNCQCEACFDQYEKKRKTMASLETQCENLVPDKAKNLMEGTLLHVTWADGHDSYYTANWLQEHCFERGMEPYMRHNYSPEPQLWNAKLCESMKKQNLFAYDELVDSSDDSKLLTLLAILQSVGFVKISGAPIGGDGEGLMALQDLISRCSPTSSVKQHDRASNFLSYDAGFQTSLPYYHHVPGIQMLHCDRPATEGTLFVDGFAVAEQIRQDFPEAGNVFDILSSLAVSFHDESPGETEGAKKFLRRRLAPTFELEKGEVWRVNYNNECRDSALLKTDSLTTIQDLYYGLQMMEVAMNEAFDRASGFEYHLVAGDVVLVNNWRVLVRHGNGATLNQAFFDWDEAQSKVNVLRGQHRDLRFNAV